MGKFLNKLRGGSEIARDKITVGVQEYADKKHNPNPSRYNLNKGKDYDFSGEEELEKENRDFNYDDNDYFDDDRVSIQPSQKPESFHHFILENQYKDLERSIRGFKDVFVKEQQAWQLKRKNDHCFTDEEAEDILRTAQSHLATDIKLGRISKDTFGDYMDALYSQLSLIFERIAEYNYGRYGSYEKQGAMKSQNLKIFLELWTRVQMNYSRAIGAAENMATHNSVRGQESLQSGERDYTDGNRGYT